MGYVYHSAYVQNETAFHPLLDAVFAGHPDWETVSLLQTDGSGYTVSVWRNTLHDYVFVGFKNPAATNPTYGVGQFTFAESYDAVTGTVTNPVTNGSYFGNANDTAFSAPVSIASLTSSEGVGAAETPFSVTPSARLMYTMITSDLFAMSVGQRVTSTTYEYFNLVGGAASTMTPTLETAPVLFMLADATGVIASGAGGKVSRTPLSGAASSGFSWNLGATTWHTSAGYGTDAFAADPTATPFTDHILYRTSGADGNGYLRATIPGLKSAVGSNGQQLTDSVGGVWEYRSGGAASTIAVCLLSGWWKVA